MRIVLRRLSKYQGSHSEGAEDYDSIKNDIKRNRESRALKGEYLDRVFNDDDEGIEKMLHTMDVVAKCCPFPFPEFDVLTIRNRWWMMSVTLNDVLSRLQTHGKRYLNIHCVFCRSRPTTGKNLNGSFA